MLQKFPDSDNNLTKQYLADFLVGKLMMKCKLENPDLTKITLLEPGAGEYAPFTEAAHKLEADTTSIEYRAVDNEKVISGIDFLDPDDDDKWRDCDNYRLIATNPPFSKGKAVAFIKRSFELLHGYGYMGFLLGLNFLASEERKLLYAEHPPHEVIVLQHRPGFIRLWDGKTGTDAREYCFIIWRGVAVKPEQTILSWSDIRDPNRKYKTR